MDPTDEQTYTAWLTTDPECLPDNYADVSVLRDHDPELTDTVPEPVLIASTTVNVFSDGAQTPALFEEAERLLESHGWQVEGPWRSVATGAVATVVRRPS